MHTTIHHIRPDTSKDFRFALRYEELKPTRSVVANSYAPAETVMGTDEPAVAYKHGQGERVNRTQGGRHMVTSTQVGDVLECVHDDGSKTWYRVDRIGFTELDIPADEDADNVGNMPHDTPLLA